MDIVWFNWLNKREGDTKYCVSTLKHIYNAFFLYNDFVIINHFVIERSVAIPAGRSPIKAGD